MTPLEDKGDNTADLKEELKQVGEDLQNPTLNDVQRNQAAAKIRRLERRIDRLEQTKKTTDDGITDPVMRSMKSDLRRLQNTVTKFVVGKDPELQKVEPYLQEVLEDYPEIASIDDADRRITAAKAIALTRHQKDNPDQERDEESSRAHREVGGAPVMSRGNRPSLTTLEQKLAGAKTSEERAAIIDVWNQQHPPT